MSDLKLCCYCKFYSVDGKVYRCIQEKNMAIDLVTGSQIMLLDCYGMRQEKAACGPTGKLFRKKD